ncbi:MAG: carbonic anhydrase family protein [Bacteroidetes bacterium]|nr:carbonic anhydrase family protein [Bacteroidota bacterium]
MTPKEAVEILKKGNQRFVGNLKMNRNLLQQINETSEGQHPFAVILSCIDSRTSAELIFDQGLGDVFSFRIAGKVQNEDILGSMEFSCKVAGAKVVVVLGHTKCGAVKGACDDVKMGNVTTLLKKLKPAIEAEKSTTNERNSRNVEYVEKVASLNVRITNQQILKNSSILKDMVMKDEIAVIGGMYNVETGVVDFYEDELITSETLTRIIHRLTFIQSTGRYIL